MQKLCGASPTTPANLASMSQFWQANTKPWLASNDVHRALRSNKISPTLPHTQPLRLNNNCLHLNQHLAAVLLLLCAPQPTAH
jgi:hypothetical protein